MTSHDDLIAEAFEASEPSVTEPSKVSPGGVDPLGLRQLNFDLMDEVLPGLNNVANQLRPFLLMSWAWRRVRLVVDHDGGVAQDDEIRDFVDRIEAIYAWSQFLVDPQADIPGGQALAELLSHATKTFEFGGPAWEGRRDVRRTSTGLISPLNYGPGLRSMGWLIPAGPAGVFRPNPELDRALDAFEAKLRHELDHDAFNRLGSVTVDKEDVRRWAVQWRLGEQDAVERSAGWERLAGSEANPIRRKGLALVQSVASSMGEHEDVSLVRRHMAEFAAESTVGSEHFDVAFTWRRLQVRQLFRLALEAWFHWLVGQLTNSPPCPTTVIARRFLDEADISPSWSGDSWLRIEKRQNPVPLIEGLTAALDGQSDQSVPSAICAALTCCLREVEAEPRPQRSLDRLPLRHAAEQLERWGETTTLEGASRIIEGWILAQHSYWCVGRGLADARGRGKRILRLRVVMEEGGWTTTPGARQGSPPVPTPDRLASALSLLRECGALA